MLDCTKLPKKNETHTFFTHFSNAASRFSLALLLHSLAAHQFVVSAVHLVGHGREHLLRMAYLEEECAQVGSIGIVHTNRLVVEQYVHSVEHDSEQSGLSQLHLALGVL